MPRVRKFCLLWTVVALLLCGRADAIVYITNPYSGSLSFEGQTNATVLATNISFATFTLAADLEKIGVATSSAAGRFMASQWSTNSIVTNQFFEFSLTADRISPIPFAAINSLELDFALRRSSTGPRQFEWRSSLDGFAAAITNFSSLNPAINLAAGVLTLPDTASTDTYAGNKLVLFAPSAPGVPNLTLRLYGFQAESSLGQGGLDTPLAFKGTVVVPEPSTAALLAFTAITGAWLARRRKVS